MGGYLVTITELERLDWGWQPLQRTDARKNDDFSFLLPFGQPSTFDGGSNNKRIPFTLLLFLLLLGDTTFGEHQTKEAAADIMATPASPPDLAFTQKT
jgi:hypothetical protein